MAGKAAWRLLLGLLVAASVLSPAAAEDDSSVRPEPRPRLIQIKVDGLSPIMLEAFVYPDDPEKFNRLPDPEGFRRAIELFRKQSGQQEVLPNLRRYFFEQGVRAQNMVAATVTLSSVSWGVIETGQPSVIKRHMSISRQTGHMQSHLDGFRDTAALVLRDARKTNAVWELDQAGVSLFADAFHPMRTYVTPWIYYRRRPRTYLTGMAKRYLTNGKKLSDPWGLFTSHMARLNADMDWPDFAEDFVADHVAEKILEKDFAGGELYDFISTFFTIDHQFHVDPNPENLVHRMARLDRRIGRILATVERSQRRSSTLVSLVSDHGSEYMPGALNLSFPLTRVFRTRLFGSHNVGTVMVEDSAHALSTPIQGIDFPRVYEASGNAYNKGEGGEKGFTTAFMDNFGNARAEVHLRNNDLNRLHLLLLARYRTLGEEQRVRLNRLLRDTLARTRAWLEPELEAYFDYYRGVRDWLPQLEERADPYWRDAAARLREENLRDAGQIVCLRRLLDLARADSPLQWLEERELEISQLIPKKYFGPHNSVYQLRHYTLNLDENLNWVETTLDDSGNPVPMDYFSILSDYRAPNPPLSYEFNPIDLFVTPLSLQPLETALAARDGLPAGLQLRRAVLVVSTAPHNLRRGHQALVLETTGNEVAYIPVRGFRQSPEGDYAFEESVDLDPVGLLYDPEFKAPNGLPAYLWLKRFHPRREWLRATYATAYTIAPLVFLDIAGVHTDRFIESSNFQQSLTGFPDEKTKQRYLRGLKWKYHAQQPDLLLWSSYLWNFSSKNHTAGGSHGGLPPQVARTTFMLWGGDAFDLPAGTVIRDPATTLDIVPTVASLLGMLDDERKVVPSPGAVRERSFISFPGTPVPVGGRQMPVASQVTYPSATHREP